MVQFMKINGLDVDYPYYYSQQPQLFSAVADSPTTRREGGVFFLRARQKYAELLLLLRSPLIHWLCSDDYNSAPLRSEEFLPLTIIVESWLLIQQQGEVTIQFFGKNRRG